MKIILTALLYLTARYIVHGWVADRELYHKELHLKKFNTLPSEIDQLRTESMRRCMWRNDIREKYRNNSKYIAHVMRIVTSSKDYKCEEHVPKMSKEKLIKTFEKPIKTNKFVNQLVEVMKIIFILPSTI